MKKFAKSFLAIGLGICLASTSFANLNINSSTNSVVATYTGGNVVLLSDIRPYLKGGANGEYSNEAIKSAVKSYVVNQLKNEWSKKAKSAVSVSESEIENILYSEAARNGLTYADFVRALAYQGYSINQVKAQIRNNLYQEKMNQYLSQNVQTQIDRDAIQFEGYKNYQIALAKGKLAKVDAYDVSYILVKTTPLFDNAQAKKKALDIAKQINSKGLSFSQAAKEYSDDIISAANGGKIGTTDSISNDEERFAIEQAVARMKTGQVSQPIQLPHQGWAIIKYDGKVKVDATLNDYINAAYQNTIASKYSQGATLEQFLLNSVIINYNFD
ncbi:peptidylprolyl isomerase [Psittacicella hinzii]|uniref:PpiC domain-containing protein n=1 Tax=Psittacicella hinzii TaxID=2028575 RepID=A0A3A1YC19_9GAMM|nr:peptidylprolyl isomerase [Psittacicella hinzii]RIY35101.1 hypothetical protein CKF58_07050 [Psittacicella hinzii]